MQEKTGHVGLTFDHAALKKSLRFAFANRFTVIQELIQNARRAGATTIWIESGDGPAGASITILDDGKGIEDFQTLLSVGLSGWDQSIKEQEKPYGMGFISTLFSAKQVEIVSLGRRVQFTCESALEDGEFVVEAYRGEERCGVTTWVTLHGFDVSGLTEAIQRMVVGYSLPVVLDGKVLARPDAEDSSFEIGQVGRIKLCQRSFDEDCVKVYLQGFLVYDGRNRGWSCGQPDVVHLDSSRWFGKFPDRDKVIDEKEMLRLVAEERAGRYKEMVLEAKAKLPALEFMEKYESLVASLGMRSVFNDIGLLPKSWFRRIHTMPHDAIHSEEYLMDAGELGEAVTREDIESGNVVIADLDTFGVGNGAEQNFRWVLAYVRDALVMRATVAEDHWIHSLVAIHEETQVELEVAGSIRSCDLDYNRTRYLGSAKIELCEDVMVVCDGVKYPVGEPVACEDTQTVHIPVENGAPMYVERCVLLQMDSYQEDDEQLTADLEHDEQALNSMIRELAANSEEERMNLCLSEALRDYSEVRQMEISLVVNASGKVAVTSLQRLHG